jgi:hypothetical protein
MARAGARLQTGTGAVRPLAVWCVSSLAEHWEPCERRRSRTVLREPEGETPSGYSPRPADLPVEQATVCELVVNVNTAQALGLTISPDIAAQVTEWIK